MMLFRPELLELILSGDKTQTRRVCKPGEQIVDDATSPDVPVAILDARGRVKWRVGQTYALQPGRGKAGIGTRIRVKRLSLDYDVRQISGADARAEGFYTERAFLYVWTSMHDPAVPDYTRISLNALSQWELSYSVDNMTYLASRPAERYRAWVIQFEVVR
ncbi:MAG: hypothetical protein JNJ61_04325 [Anaerolineae bacterium]|nr:hypothetical protein [Anaerolineae bacterium]